MKNILITGANRGIGFQLTSQLLARGERVFAGCRQPQQAADLQDLAGSYPDRLTIVGLDVSDDDSVQAAKTAVAQQTDRLDWLINNAAVHFRPEPFATFDPTIMARTLDVNVIGMMRVVTGFVELLRRGSAPKLLNISSQLGSLQRVRPNWTSYSYNTSKAALNMLTRMLAFELEADGISVVAIHPGWVQTDMGGPHAAVTVPDSAAGIIRLGDKLTMAETNKFYIYNGDEHPW